MTPVCSGATLFCSCGTAPSKLLVKNRGFSYGTSAAAATVMDHVPLENIPPFEQCTAAANPAPMSGTAKACVPSFSAPWSCEVLEITLHGVPVLDASATLACAYGGTVSITDSGQKLTRHTPRLPGRTAPGSRRGRP